MILITGSSGFIGSKVVEKLQYQEVDYITGSYNPQIIEYEFKHKGSLISEKDLSTYLDKIQIILHIGAWIPKNTLEADDVNLSLTNIASTSKLLNFKYKNLNKIIFMSTTDVYPSNELVNESTIPNPQTSYAWSKLINENQIYQFSKRLSHKCLILRVGNVYGPGDGSYDKVLQTIIKSASNNRIIEVNSNTLRHFLFINDLVAYVCESLTKINVSALINITGSSSYKLSEVVKMIYEVFPVNKFSIKLIQNVSNNDHTFDTTKMNKTFNLRQTELEIGLLDYLK
jgi:nucleoside-diphosphate-sugar epimerase